MGWYQREEQRQQRRESSEIKPKKTIKREIIEQYSRDLRSSKVGMDYLLKQRGMTEETISRFSLGIVGTPGQEAITIPHFKGGEVVNIKHRRLNVSDSDTKYYRIAGCETALFNEDILDDDLEDVMVVEGEFDAMILSQNGYHRVVGLTAGALTFLGTWKRKLDKVPLIHVALDNDEAGNLGATKIIQDLGPHKCFKVELPKGLDVSEYVLKSGIDNFKKQYSKAHRTKIEGTSDFKSSLDSLSDFLKKENDANFIDTPFPKLNELIGGGFRPGELIVLGAPGKIGKTNFALNLSLHLLKKEIPVVFYCLEMPDYRLSERLLKAHLYREHISEEVICSARHKYPWPISYCDSWRHESMDETINRFRNMIRYNDAKFAVFDNLHALVREINNQTEKIGVATMMFKKLAVELHIPILLVAQPRKKEVGSKGKIITADDLKYANTIHQDCDRMILLHRDSINRDPEDIVGNTHFQEFKDTHYPRTHVRIEADRYCSGGDMVLYYKGKYSIYENYRKEVST